MACHLRKYIYFDKNFKNVRKIKHLEVEAQIHLLKQI